MRKDEKEVTVLNLNYNYQTINVIIVRDIYFEALPTKKA